MKKSRTKSQPAAVEGRSAKTSPLKARVAELEREVSALTAGLALERALVSIASRFASTSPESFGPEIDRTLATIGRLAGVDRSYLYRLSPDRSAMTRTNLWTAPGVESGEDRLRELPLRTGSWIMGKLLRMETVSLPRLAGMPSLAGRDREFLEREGVRSLLHAPISHGDGLVAFIGFDLLQEERDWDQPVILLQETVARVLAGALAREEARQELKQARKRFDLFMSHLPGHAFVKDSEGRYVYSSLASENRQGGPQDLIEKTDFDLCPPGLAERYWKNDQAVLRGGRTMEFIEPGLLGSSKRIYRTTKFPILEDGRPVMVGGMRFDITERQTARRVLEASEERYRLLVENANEGIIVAQEGLLKFHNRKAQEISGYSDQELSQTSFFELIHPEDRDLVMQVHACRIEGEEVPAVYEFRILDKFGRTRWIEVNGVLIQWAGRPAVLNFLTDITHRKEAEEERARLEAQLRQAQKMEAIGTLAGGIAHDFNNILQAISGYVELMALKGDRDRADRETLAKIEAAAERASELVRRLLTFGRKVESRLRPLDLNREIRQALGVIERIIPKMIDLELDLATCLSPVNADPNQIEQVLLNLGANAGDAMPDGGKLVITTSEVNLSDLFCRANPGSRPGPHVLLTISDTGPGMGRDTLAHLYEPFYTTKEVGKGTGLGLAMVYGIVKNHQGYIACSSRLGKGTTFKVYLPALQGQETAAPPPPAEEETGPGQERGGVLLVDDEEQVLEVAREFLTMAGFSVLVAETGERALEIYRERPDLIDVVVLDLGMPGMGGKRCLRELVKLDPEVRIIVASGYSGEGLAGEVARSGAREFVAKPYRFPELVKTIRRHLGRAD